MIRAFLALPRRWIICGCIGAGALLIPLAMGITGPKGRSEPKLLPEGRMPPKVMKKQPGKR